MYFLHGYAGSLVKFIVLDWGVKVDFGMGLSYLPASLTTLCRSQLYPPVRDLELGFKEYLACVLLTQYSSTFSKFTRSPVDKGPGINGLAQENLGNNPVDESGQAHADGNGGNPGGNCNNRLILTVGKFRKSSNKC
jgi:hypothetical protein